MRESFEKMSSGFGDGRKGFKEGYILYGEVVRHDG